MIRFSIDYEYLDLPADFSLQFKKTNILFAFDDIECERSVSFNIPATPQNNRIFALAKCVQTDGVGMRRRYNAQMQAGLVVRDGYLHIDQYSGGVYKAIYITGELIGLQQIKEAGKIREYYKPTNGVVWSASSIRDANTAAGQAMYAMTRYIQTGLLHPSYDLGDIMQNAYNALTGRSLSDIVRGYRLVPKEVQGVQSEDVTYVFAGSGASPTTTPSAAPFAGSVRIAALGSAVTTNLQTLLVRDSGGEDKYIRIYQLVAMQDLTITFPSDFPTNLFLMSITYQEDVTDSEPTESVYSESWFLGGWLFRNLPTPDYADMPTDGTPLAGQSITVPKGTIFGIFDSSKFKNLTNGTNGFIYISATDIEQSLIVENEEIHEGDTIRMCDVLPDLTLVELFKIYSYLEGKVLYYTETDGVQFDELNMDTWNAIDVTGRVIQSSNITRKFGDYVQRNIVEFDSGAEVLESQRIRISYDIDNENLASEKVLGKIPYSEGRVLSERSVACAVFKSDENNVLSASGIMVATGTTADAPAYSKRIALQKNDGLQSLLDASTSMTIQVRMTILEFNTITPKTAIYYEGLRYVWTEATWSKDVANIKVSKILA